MPSQATSYTADSVFTIRCTPEQPPHKRQFAIERHPAPLAPNDTSFDVAVVQFNDDGTLVDQAQVSAAEACIARARSTPTLTQGPLVVVFIHGWHHGAGWHRTPSIDATVPDGDTHFHAFRLILESLTLREAERYAALNGAPIGRRIIGVYLGWNGDPADAFISRIPIVTHGTFWSRYKVAEQIGAHTQFQDTVRRIVETVKAPGQECPLVFVGHSMGALMLQSAFATLLESTQHALMQPASSAALGPVEIRSHGALVSFPDLVLSLNSAADSSIAQRIVSAMRVRGITKTAASGLVTYSPPLLMSVTSTHDRDTGVIWRAARPGRSTDGHDSRLFTHDFVQSSAGSVPCQPRGGLDFGQNWHCVRCPDPPFKATPNIPIDLPTRERDGQADFNVPHVRYTIATKDPASIGEPRLMWVFQVPPEIVEDHNDIFNSRARSLVLGLIQISGAVASLAETWEQTFERM